MRAIRLKIGGKLAASAGLGVVLVAGMLANQQLSFGSVAERYGRAFSEQKLVEEVVFGNEALRAMQIARRDIQLSESPEAVDKAITALRGSAATAKKRYTDALALMSREENRQRAKAITSLVDQYAGAMMEMAEAQNDYLRLGPARAGIAAAWTQHYQELIVSPALAGLANRHEVESAIVAAHVHFYDAQVAAWQWTATHDVQQVDRLAKGLTDTVAALDRARKLTTDKTVVQGIELLGTVVGPFKGLIDQAVKDRGLVAGHQARGAQSRTEIDHLSEQVVSSAAEVAQSTKAQALAAIEQAGGIGWGVGLFVTAVLVGSAVFGAVSIAKPIRRIGEVLLELAHGNKGVDIPYTARVDEVGDNARAAQTFRDNLVRMETYEAERRDAEARAAEEKRLTTEREAAQQRAAEEKATAERKAAVNKLAGDFEAAVGTIIGTVSSASTELEAAATTLTKTAETTQHLSGTVASASEQASANVQSVASAAEEMAGSVGEVSRQVQESSRIASEAVRQAEKTDARITELSQAASRIGDVVKLITAIAEQTNLLALNATIEAARAGEAGRGFAVVASEVKALAAQTAKATGEIGTQIAGMQTATAESVAAIKEIGETIRRVSEIAATIAAAVEEQGAATQEISRNVQQAALGTAQVASSITDVNRGAGETGSASAQVLSSAQSLANESNHLKTAVEKFLHSIRVDVTMNFEEAIHAHGAWKDKLSAYIKKPDRSLKCDVVGRDDQCALGNWIHGDGSCYAHLGQFRTMKEAHARFHAAAGDIIRRADRGEKIDIETDLNGGSPYAKASADVVGALRVLKKAAA